MYRNPVPNQADLRDMCVEGDVAEGYVSAFRKKNQLAVDMAFL